MADASDTRTTTPNASQTSVPSVEKPAAPSACCGGPAPPGTDACCAKDADVKSAGGTGCGCSSTSHDR
jgi:hypothetical protein